MNIEKEVFGKLFQQEKVELASQKYDFGVIEDSRALLDKAFQFVEIQSEVIAIENKLKKALPIYQEVIKKTDDAIAKLKELGMDAGLISSLEKQNAEAALGIKNVNNSITYISKLI